MGGQSGALPAQGPAQAGSAGAGDTSRRFGMSPEKEIPAGLCHLHGKSFSLW